MQIKVVPIGSLPALNEVDMKHVVKGAMETYLKQLDTHYPIVMKDGGISSGHGRLWAARQAGRTSVPIQELD